MRKASFGLACLLSSTFALPPIVSATEVYRWTDQDGNVHFGSHPPHKDTATFLFKSESQVKTPDKSPAKRKQGTVRKVTDGDTIVLANTYRLRLAGINAPEVAQAGKPGQRGGEAARQYLEQLVLPQSGSAKIDYESAEEMRDRYGRYLVHVFNLDGSNVNERLLEEGLVHASINPPNLKYMEAYLAAEKRARNARRGIWAYSDYRTFKSTEVLDSRNQFRRVEITVTSLDSDAEHHILRTQSGFSARIPKKDLAAFDAPNTYLGKTFIVRGWIKMRRNQLYIELRHPLQIEAVPSAQSPTDSQ